MHVLPREVCTAITYHAARADLIVLSRTSRTLQRAAERKIYEEVNLQDPAIVFEFCKSLIAKNGARGVYVRRFWFMYEPRRRTTPLPRHFWQAIHAAFVAMVNLELLWISDPDLQNSWVLADTKFQLVDASLIFAWDQHLVRFLQRQTRLRVLYTHDAPEDSPICTLPPGSLPALEQYLGPLTVAGELLQCPLTHLQVIMDDVVLPILPSFLADAGKACKRLRSLSILSVLEPMLFEVVQLVLASVFAPRLRYLGTLAYPCQNRHELFQYLMLLPELDTIDLDVTSWNPRPIEMFQRMLAAELKSYCPNLQRVGFWVDHHHLVWWFQDEEWIGGQLTGRAALHERFWRSV